MLKPKAWAKIGPVKESMISITPSLNTIKDPMTAVSKLILETDFFKFAIEKRT